ncbi:MAG: class I SAM-dependent methyltransferase [Deltaproteobacteria bacterium]|nr:class I SAM-dependent methyltransferase [Deltaproteobacteria bacterium]
MMMPLAYEANAEFDSTHWWFLGRIEIIRAVVQRFAGPKADGSLRALSVIDYGCGTGGVSQTLKSGFGQYRCFEPSKEGADACRSRGLQIFTTQTEMRKAVTDGSDLVFLLDVLEHVENEAALLNEACTYLNPTGLLLLTVPAYEWLWGGEDVISRHIRRYSRASLRASIESAGLELVYMSGFNFFLLPLQIAVVLASRNLYPKETMTGKSTNLRRPGPLQQKICLGLLRLEAGLLRTFSFPWGGSLLAVVRKKRNS